jgi:murein DD-endopeptidase MepM/ murein hydrolase activator NlpD
MQKDDRFYTFLVTHTSKSKIYIRRVEISKRWLHSSVAAAVVAIGLGTAGIGGALNLDQSLMAGSNQAEVSPMVQQVSAVQPISDNNDIKTINYARPANSANLNTGGPSAPFQLTMGETETGENAIEAELNTIERTSNPDFLPNIWSHMGKINNEFGFRRNPFGGRSYEFHGGIDIDGEKGDVVVAPGSGVVVKASYSGGYGNLIEIDHGNGLKTRYGHLSRIDIAVGDSVQRGQQIGLLGSTGRSTGPHLHYELRLNDKAINPRRFLPPEMPN